MTKRVSMATRKELIESIGARYRASTVAERSAILDEFVAITGLADDNYLGRMTTTILAG